MNKVTNDTIQKTIHLIDDLITKYRSVKNIKWHIHEMLISNQINISDIDHFDRYYFKPMTGVRIATYVRNAQLDFASKRYEKENKSLKLKDKYCNVSQFKKKYKQKRTGKTMRKYMITELWLLDGEDLNHESCLESNDGIILIEAETKEAAIHKYLRAVMESTPQYAIKQTIFKYMWDCTAYGELDAFVGLDNEEEIFKFSERIYNDYFNSDKLDPDKTFLDNDTNMLAEEFWQLLREEERVEAFVCCNYCEVVCLELTTLAKWRKEKKSLIIKAETNDFRILNAISNHIRKEKKEKYIFTPKSFLDLGYSEEEAKELISRIVNNKFKYSLQYHTEEACYLGVNLINEIRIKSIEGIEIIEIKPHELLIRLAGAGYNFNETTPQKVKKIIEDWMDINKFKSSV